MGRLHVLGVAAVLVVACALPKVEIDESLGNAGTTGGKGGGSSGGSGAGGSAGKGSSGTGGTGGFVGVAGAGAEDERENKCGEYCEAYITNCADFPANTYDNETDCLTTCFTSDWPLGDDMAEVNSLQCRVLHSHLAATSQIPHCYHSAEFPSMGSCAPPQ